MNESKTVQNYLDLITSEHSQKPNFTATITSVVSVLVQIQTLLASMIDLFDLSLDPVGDQLNTIGEWVGAKRQINSPFAGIYFTWNGTASDGWNAGIWQQAGAPSAIVTLPDDIYLTYIKAKIAINAWDGTINGIYDIWAAVLPEYAIAIQDLQNMSFVVIVGGQVLDSLTKALLAAGYLTPRPEGVGIAYYVTGNQSGPIFAWNCESTALQGWNQGQWGVTLTPT